MKAVSILALIVGVHATAPTEALTLFINAAVQSFIPTINTAVAGQLAAFDPYSIPAIDPITLDKIDLGKICKANAKATMSEATVQGAKTLKITSAAVNSLSINGAVVTANVNFTAAGKLEGSASFDGTASCSLLGQSVSQSAKLSASFSAAIQGIFTFALTADVLAALEKKCVQSLTPTSVAISHTDLQLNVTTNNIVFDAILPMFQDKFKSLLESEFVKLENKWSTQIMTMLPNATTSLICQPTQPPTRRPTTPPMTDSPTTTPQGVEPLINGEFAKQIPSINAQVVTAFKTYDPYTIPVPAAPLTKSMDMGGVCTLNATAAITAGSVYGASNMVVESITMTNSSNEGGLVVGDVIIKMNTRLHGSVNIAAAGTCNNLNVTSNVTAGFMTSVRANLVIRVTADLLVALKSKCINKAKPVGLFLVVSNLQVNLTTSNPIFEPLIPVMLEYVTPLLDDQINRLKTLIDLNATSTAVLSKMTCPPTPPPASPTPPPASASPTKAPTTALRISSAVSVSSFFGLFSSLCAALYFM